MNDGRTAGQMVGFACRLCGAALEQSLVSLRASPLANSLLTRDTLRRQEPTYPLTVYLCGHCLLAQLPEFERAQNIFSDYAYFSSFSDSWLAHCRAYAEAVCTRFGIDAGWLVMELASNDGYLLQYFIERGVPVLGIEPSFTVAKAAREKGIETIEEFFGAKLAVRLVQEKRRPRLLIANNVLAHVPDLNDFVAGMRTALAPDGVVTVEFPHLVNLIEQVQFDTIYHEHFSYFTLHTAEKAFTRHGLVVFDVEEIPTHGGSLRLFARHVENETHPVSPRVEALRRREREGGYDKIGRYMRFEEEVRRVKRDFLRFLIDAKSAGKTLAAYGAPAKGATFLNYCGVGTDFIDFTVDRNPYKQGRYLPGVRIPIRAPEAIAAAKPDYVVILPWNIADEIVQSMAHIRGWGGKFVIALPRLKVLK